MVRGGPHAPLTAPAPLLAISTFWMALVPPVKSTYSCSYESVVPGGYRVVGSALARWLAAQCGGRDRSEGNRGVRWLVLEFPCADDERIDTVGRVKGRASRWWCDRPTWTEPKFSLVAMV